MASVTRALCGVLALFLSGAPTVLLACAAWCLPGMSHGAAQAVAMTVAVQAAVADAGAMDASAHAHHHVAALEAPAQTVPFTGGVRLGAPTSGADAHGCCPDAPTLTAATATPASRADARSTTWAIATRPALHRHLRVTPVALLRLSPAATRVRPQTPLVLRV